jgi:hypothetical protein
MARSPRPTPVAEDPGSSSAIADTVVVPRALLARIVERLDEHDARLGMLERQHAPRDDDDRAVLLALVAAAVGTLFSAREVWQHRRVAPKLAAALDAADVGNARGLAKLFRRIEGHDINGFRLVRVGKDRDGLLWRIVRV